MAGSTASVRSDSPVSPSDRDAGASPLFPPQHVQAAEAKEALLHVIRRDPHQFGIRRARWRLTDLLAQCEWLHLETEGGLSRLLKRLEISYQRGRDHIHSPDPHYEAKLAWRDAVVERARASAGQVVALYQDELTYYRQPSVAQAYAQRGGDSPYAQRCPGKDTATRTTATLNPLTGRVEYWQGSRVSIPRLVAFYQQLHRAYPEADTIYVIQDNGTVHFHPDVLVALVEQESPYPRYRKWGACQLPIQLVPLPTYASWTNPIEKLWRWLKQDVLHLHPLATDLKALRGEVRQFLERFADGSPELLRYVGLLVPV
jgi:transposase